jgi:ferredoxin
VARPPPVPAPAAPAEPRQRAPPRPPPARQTAVAEEDDDLAMEPYIETERCTTCNECTNLNGKMFAYNENKQAYIKDPAPARSRSWCRRRRSARPASSTRERR